MKLGNNEYVTIQAQAGKILLSMDTAVKKINKGKKPDLIPNGLFDNFTDNQMFKIQEAVEKILIQESRK